MTLFFKGGGVTRPLRLLVPFTFLCLAFFCISFLPVGCGSNNAAVSDLLPVPDALSITAADQTVTLTWDPVTDATAYNVYWGMTSGVTKKTGTVIENAISPLVHEGLTNGMTYCYVVTARFGTLESGESPELAAVPHPPAPGVPQEVTASVAPEQPNATLIEWSSVELATSYNLYWNNQGDVSKSDSVFIGATSPFLHTVLSGGTPYYYAATALNDFVESDLSSEVMATPRGPETPSGGDEGLGNNLSYPVVFADGYGVSGLLLGDAEPPWLEFNTGLRPSATEVTSDTVYPVFDPTTVYVLGETEYYEQKTVSTWQASWVNAGGDELDVLVDWGDNLWAQHFTTNSVVRIETILYQTAASSITTSTEFTDPTTAYEMALLYGSGITEQQGTNTVTYAPLTRHVFSVLGRLKIEKLEGPGGAVDDSVPAIDKSVCESFGFDGPGGYGAEVNVGGKVVYGYVWFLNKEALTDQQKTGWWRITFSLDDDGLIGQTTVNNQTNILGLHESDSAFAELVDSQTTYVEIEVGSH